MPDDNMQIASHAGPYTVQFYAQVTDAARAIVPDSPYHVVVDERVSGLHSAGLRPLLTNAASVLSLAATENVKSLEELPSLIASLVNAGIRRDHALIAIGGGVVQDLTCFMASMLFRGMKWVFLPTTLLAQSDSCIGSKSSINAAGVKNLVGNFYPPHRIAVATDFLETLDERDVHSGIGEILKVHIIDGPESFDWLAQNFDALFVDPAVMRRAVRSALEIKKKLVEIDEFDRGPRMVMNYGHSFGHAIETATEFAVPHGIAVTIGVDMANFVAVRMGRMAVGQFNRMHPTLRKNYQEFEAAKIPLDLMLGALGRDKKNIGKDLVLILPDKDARIERVLVPAGGNFPDYCREFLDRVRISDEIAA
jgi:3-dehydroquinate synthase